MLDVPIVEIGCEFSFAVNNQWNTFFSPIAYHFKIVCVKRKPIALR